MYFLFYKIYINYPPATIDAIHSDIPIPKINHNWVKENPMVPNKRPVAATIYFERFVGLVSKINTLLQG